MRYAARHAAPAHWPRALALFGAATITVVGLMLQLVLLPGSAAAEAPVAQGWWNGAYLAGGPQPPAPPDVGAEDLLVQSGPPGMSGTPQPSAVSALHFVVPADARVGALTLTVGGRPFARDVRAYPAAAPWTPAQNGAWNDAPAADPARYSAGVLADDGTSLRFTDIGRLVREDGTLSIVLVPGSTDRVVIRKPTTNALTVTADPSRTTTSPAGGQPPPEPWWTAPPPASPPAFALPPLAPVVTPAPAPSATSSGRTPEIAPSGVAQPRSQRDTALLARTAPDDARTRWLAAIEAVLVLATFGVLGWGPFAPVARRFGVVMAEDKRRPRGVGRFTSPRTGSAPPL